MIGLGCDPGAVTAVVAVDFGCPGRPRLIARAAIGRRDPARLPPWPEFRARALPVVLAACAAAGGPHLVRAATEDAGVGVAWRGGPAAALFAQRARFWFEAACNEAGILEGVSGCPGVLSVVGSSWKKAWIGSGGSGGRGKGEESREARAAYVARSRALFPGAPPFGADEAAALGIAAWAALEGWRDEWAA